jgi:zinc-dependent metalloproteinase lipoprotein
MKHYIYILLAMLAFVFSGCSSSDNEANTSGSVVDEDDDNTTQTIDDNYTYKLPVIFHVLYSDATDKSQYIDASRLKEILNNVNDLYAGNIYGAQFNTTSANVNVKFVLAEYDENGKKLATPGVEYVKWTGTYPIDPYDFMGDHKDYVKYLWEPNDYINVMMYNFKSEEGTNSETLGISHMPYKIKGDAIEGLSELDASKVNLTKKNLSFAYCSSINSKYAWKNSDGLYYEPDRYTNSDHRLLEKTVYAWQIAMDINVTLAHELGHYLGLHHSFTEKETSDGFEPVDSCGNTDYCEDTPSYNRIKYQNDLITYQNSLKNGGSLSLTKVTGRYSCEADSFASANIMDYYYSYGFKISSDQKWRIRQVLYYSPLIPGPKKTRTSSAAKAAATRAVEGIVDLPIRMAK